MIGIRRGTLFAKTAATIAMVSFTFFIFTFVLIAAFIVLPLAQRSAHDLASLMVISVATWERLPESSRDEFRAALATDHGLQLNDNLSDLVPNSRHRPFFLLLERSLQEHLGRVVPVEQRAGEEDHDRFWARIPSAGGPVLVGFRYSHRDGMEPPMLLLLVLLVGTLATLATSVVLARRLTHPLELLSQATRHVGAGEAIRPLPETGPLELAELVRGFNDMTQQVQDLLANRTTLLSGISHDLRTPLTRIELALEMLEERPDPRLIQGIRRDLEQMNRLIGLFLEIGRGLQEEKRQDVDIAPLVGEVVADFRRNGTRVEWEPGFSCRRTIHPLALRRIVNNLMENAVRYGGGQSITVGCRPEGNAILVEVQDRGPGIPDDQREAVFRPFHRLEKSRSTVTGGSGLGLSIVRQLAQANRCRVELLPREGGGTCARVTIAK